MRQVIICLLFTLLPSLTAQAETKKIPVEIHYYAMQAKHDPTNVLPYILKETLSASPYVTVNEPYGTREGRHIEIRIRSMTDLRDMKASYVSAELWNWRDNGRGGAGANIFGGTGLMFPCHGDAIAGCAKHIAEYVNHWAAYEF